MTTPHSPPVHGPSANYQRALFWYDIVTARLRVSPQASEAYPLIVEALRELIGFRLLSIQRVTPDGAFLERAHTSDPRFPLGGRKPITDDPFLMELIRNGEPVITADAPAVRKAFRDHEALLALGCSALLNVPILAGAATIGCLNLAHSEGWFVREHILLAQPFGALLALCWLTDSVE